MTKKEIITKLEELDKRIEGTLNSPYTRGAQAVNAKCHQLKQKYLKKLNKLENK